MHYVVMDLEWNQPMAYEYDLYYTSTERLLFEIIQIGAVKLDESLHIVDTISLSIKPIRYLHIHPRIKRMTGIKAADLAGSPLFLEAMKEFIAWCGSESILLTWGCDDISVLYHNINFFHFQIDIPSFYDVQMLFNEFIKGGKDRKSLANAMVILGIEHDSEKAFHNALNDAYYTALVYQRLPNQNEINTYPVLPKLLARKKKTRYCMRSAMPYDSFLSALGSEEAKHPFCPICREKTELNKDGYTCLTYDKYAGLSYCKKHGVIYCMLYFDIGKENNVWMSLIPVPADKLRIAYIHTKQSASALPYGLLPDPEERRVSNLPFED